MTPTSEDRRDVAARLRHEADGFRRLENELGQLTIDLGEVTAVFQDVAHFAGLDGTVRTCVLLDRLADLIDPTCHVIPGEEAVAELKDGTRLTGVPLSCGHVVFGVSAKDMPKFCCECGSRITSGGER
ncbi:hypothetical protein [Olsenella sp. AM39-30AC]|uniref:hypothetical protein n=1 Tax=Olsenella sp. AM39-30AC TaxID=2292360 RepID=UPI00131418E8|nr:hypothetical protein [Olsenella sp. AM39-30AC]